MHAACTISKVLAYYATIELHGASIHKDSAAIFRPVADDITPIHAESALGLYIHASTILG